MIEGCCKDLATPGRTDGVLMAEMIKPKHRKNDSLTPQLSTEYYTDIDKELEFSE